MAEEPYEPDSMDITPEQALQDALKDITENTHPLGRPTKLLIVALWDDEGHYHTRFYNSGMCCSEMAALCHHHAHKMHNHMSGVQPL